MENLIELLLGQLKLKISGSEADKLLRQGHVPLAPSSPFFGLHLRRSQWSGNGTTESSELAALRPAAIGAARPRGIAWPLGSRSPDGLAWAGRRADARSPMGAAGRELSPPHFLNVRADSDTEGARGLVVASGRGGRLHGASASKAPSPPSQPPADRLPPAPALSLPRPFRRRRRVESGLGEAQGRGGWRRSDPAASRAQEDRGSAAVWII